mgnify:CR=1 FL=1
MQNLNTYEQSLEMLYQDLKRKGESTEKKSKTSSYSPFGAFCISWWSHSGLQKLYVKDRGRAEFMFERLRRTKDLKNSLCMLSQDDLLLRIG